MQMKMESAERVEPVDRMALRYQLIELQEFERGTAEAAAVRAALGLPVDEESQEHARLPLIIVGYDARRISDLLAAQRSEPRTGVRPIAVVGVGDNGRLEPMIHQLSDLVLPPHPGRDDLLDVGHTLAVLSQRLDEIPLAVDDRALLLLQLAHSRNRPLEPIVDADASLAYDYPLVDLLLNTSPEQTFETLADMARHGIFEATPVDRVFVCPDCHGYRVPVKELCPECHSSNLSLESSLHHFRCGYVAPESEFMVHGRPVCPKCHTPMRHIGVEYNRPGYFSVCHDCGHWVSEPELRAWCVACNTYHRPNELVPVHVKRFALSKDGIEIARAGSWDRDEVHALTYRGRVSGVPATRDDEYARELTRLLLSVAGDRKHPMTVYRVALPPREAADAKFVSRVEKFLCRMAANRDLVTQLDFATFLVVLPRNRHRLPDGGAIRRILAAKFNLQVQVSPLQADDPGNLRASA